MSPGTTIPTFRDRVRVVPDPLLYLKGVEWFGRTLLALLVVTSCSSGDGQRRTAAEAVPPCAEVDRGEWSAHATTVIEDEAEPPCLLVLDTTVVRSYSATEAASLDLDRVRAVDRHGNVYLQGYDPGVISVLSPSGALIGRLGGEGAGPGELQAGHLGVDVSSLDSIYVKDNRLIWSVFDSDWQFVRSTTLGAIDAGTGRHCLFSDGSVISAAPIRGGAQPATLRLVAPDGKIEAEFGRPTSGAITRTTLPRELACGLDNAIWALPSPLEPGYRLERWSHDGTLEQAIIRDAPWFDARAPVTRSESMESKPPSAVRQVFEVQRGLLFTVVVTADSRWAPVSREEREAMVDKQVDVRYEALDAISGRLLAVLQVDDVHTLPNEPILRDGQIHEFVVDSTGGARLMAYRLRLRERR